MNFECSTVTREGVQRGVDLEPVARSGQGGRLTREQGLGGAHSACGASPPAGSAACAPAQTSPLPEKDHPSPASTLQACFPVRTSFQSCSHDEPRCKGAPRLLDLCPPQTGRTWGGQGP